MEKNTILGFHTGHDVSYCLLENGIPVVHEELERFLRIKEPKGDGLEFALERLPDEITSNIKYFTYGNPGARKSSKNRFFIACNPRYVNYNLNEKSNDKMKSIINKNNGEFFIIGHHQSHAAHAFFSSNYDEALVITIDGKGAEKNDYKDIICETKSPASSTREKPHKLHCFNSSFTIWEGKDNKIKPLLRMKTHEITIGSIWKEYCRRIFKLPWEAPQGFAGGTIMAMASVGEPKYWEDFYKAFKTYGGSKNKDVTNNCIKYKTIVHKSEQDKFDVAASLQKATEQITYDIIKPYVIKHKPKNICFAGGVILNSVMMGKMYDWFKDEKVENIFVCSVPYDGGLSIGAAQYVWHQVLDNPRINWDGGFSSYMGVTYNEEEIKKSLQRDDITYSKTTDEEVLNLLDKQNIISLFQGAAESGKRALGNRSIIADPRSPNMKNLINEKVKHRQWFRPFAPSILREDVKDWFVRDVDSPYMGVVLPFKEEVKDKVPAVVHLDGTGRLQTVTKKNNKWYYNFIKKWKEKTGIPILLNTSFNDREPIVETPEHAINCFIGTNIDYLYFSDCNLLVKKQ
tara:strand:+ start:85 stop:1800 length:1716 start_codon:yes stop_codon:yes gene_type:complete